jgi:Tfp pilus assembly protein PilO
MTARTPQRWMVDAAGAGLVLLAAGAAWPGAVAPWLEARATRAGLADDARTREARLEELRSATTTAEMTAAKLAETARRRGIDLRPVSAFNERLDDITRLAEAAGLVVDELTPGDRRDAGSLLVTPIALRGRGTYPACAVFLSGLAREFPDAAVAGFDLSGSPEDESGVISFVFDLEWYAAREPAARGVPVGGAGQ